MEQREAVGVWSGWGVGVQSGWGVGGGRGIWRASELQSQMEEEIQQFEVVQSSSHSFRRESTHAAVLQSCLEVERELVHEFLISTVTKIVSYARDQHLNDDDDCQLITVQFLKNQLEDFPIFIKMVIDRYTQHKFELFPNLPPEKVEVVVLMQSEVRQIVLNMYIYLQENPQFDFVVFIVNEMTDLDEWNMYCFEKGLRRTRLLLVIASHHEFDSRKMLNGHFQKQHHQLYNHRDLFCEYFYTCLTHPTIRPYLPPEALTLITDMNYYSLSFKESCRRFRFCLQRSLMLYRKERQWVEFEKLIEIIEIALMKEIRFYTGDRGISKEKLLKVILTENESIHISEKTIVFEIAMRTNTQELVEEENIIYCMREHVRNALLKKENFKKYAAFLEEKTEPTQPKEPRKKKTRSELLGIDSKKNITPKNALENQITKIIKEATAGIRQQAAHIRWEDISYELRIKPQLPYLIKEAWAADEDAAELVEEISKNYSAPLVHYLKLFKEKGLGKGIYLIKCLELAGLVEIRKGQVKPMVYTNFFDKANFKILS